MSELFAAEQALLQRPAFDAADVDAATVVGDLEVDLAALVEGPQQQVALRGLAAGRPHRPS